MKTITEEKRIQDLLFHENSFWSRGISCIAGVDEAGRGPLAGPVVAAAVVFPKHIFIQRINDSKKLTAKTRESLYKIIQRTAISIGIGIVDETEIDNINILQASYKAMQIAVSKLTKPPDYILVDGRENPLLSNPQLAIVGGDGKSFSIAAASIVAKVERDFIMTEYDKIYPCYGFARHKGYPTREHVRAIHQNGLSPIHRKTFKIRALYEK